MSKDQTTFADKVKQYFLRKFNTAQSYGIMGQPRSPITVPWGTWDTQRAVRCGYRANTYIYACVKEWMTSVQAVPLRVYTRKGDKWEAAPQHPLQMLLDNPNPYMTLSRLMRIATGHQKLAGNALWSKVRDSKKQVMELWPINPDSIKPVPSEDNYIAYYVPTWRSQPKEIPVEDIIHFQEEDPGCPYWGVGPLQAASRAIDTDNSASDWNKNAMDNRAVPDGVLSFKGPIAKDQYNIAREKLKERQGVKNARELLIMNQEVSWQSLGLSPVEMDFLQSRKFTREEFASVFSVPPILVGISENAPLSNENVRAAARLFWQTKVLPFLQSMRDTLNLQLTPEFGDTKDLMIDYDISGVEALQVDMQAKATTAKALWDMGLPFNTINQRLEMGFDDIEGGNSGYISPALIPVNSVQDMVNRILNEPEKPKPDDTDPANPPPAEGDEVPEEGDEDAAEPKSFKGWTMKALKDLDLIARDMRVEQWKLLEAQRTPFDVKGARLFAKTLTDEGDAAAAAFLKSDGDMASAINAVEPGRWDEDLKGFYSDVVEHFGKLTNNKFEKQLAGRKKSRQIKTFDLASAAILAWLELTAAKRATLIAETSKKEVASIITEGVKAGLSVDKIARGIRVFYAERKLSRAMTIARTEVVAASNFGSWQGAKQTSVPMVRTWMATADDRVRDAHKEADGELAGMDGSFNVGGEQLMYPGDPAGDASNVINCRCGVDYSVDPQFLQEE